MTPSTAPAETPAETPAMTPDNKAHPQHRNTPACLLFDENKFTLEEEVEFLKDTSVVDLRQATTSEHLDWLLAQSKKYWPDDHPRPNVDCLTTGDIRLTWCSHHGCDYYLIVCPHRGDGTVYRFHQDANVAGMELSQPRQRLPDLNQRSSWAALAKYMRAPLPPEEQRD